MSPLHPPRGLSATAGAPHSPKDAAVPPAPQTSEPLTPELAAAPGAGVCCGFSSSFLEENTTTGWGPRHPSSGSAPASASKFCARPKQSPFPASPSPCPPLRRGVAGGTRTPYLPCPRVGNLLPSAVMGPAGHSERLCSGMGRSSPALSRFALSVGTSGRATRWRTLLLPVPALLRPTLRAGRNVWPAQPGSHRRHGFILLTRLPGPPGPPERSVSGKGAPGPGAVQGEQGHQGPLECRERRVRPGKGEKCFLEKSGVSFACVPSLAYPAGLGSHLAPYAQMPLGWGIKIPLVGSAVRTLQKNPSVISEG